MLLFADHGAWLIPTSRGTGTPVILPGTRGPLGFTICNTYGNGAYGRPSPPKPDPELGLPQPELREVSL